MRKWYLSWIILVVVIFTWMENGWVNLVLSYWIRSLLLFLVTWLHVVVRSPLFKIWLFKPLYFLIYFLFQKLRGIIRYWLACDLWLKLTLNELHFFVMVFTSQSWLQWKRGTFLLCFFWIRENVFKFKLIVM